MAHDHRARITPASRSPTSTRSVAFYRDILGFELVFQWNPQADYIRTTRRLSRTPTSTPRSCGCRTATYFLEILEYRNVEKAPVDTRTANPGTAHIAFFTDDCDGALRRAAREGRGVRVSAPVTPDDRARTRAVGRST